MKTSESVVNITKALLAAQPKFEAVIKDAENTFFKKDGKGTAYATLESVINATKKALQEQQIIVVQSIGTKVLTTRLQHSSGEYFEEESELILSKADMQGLGSSISYMRRYQLSAMLNLAQTDDDGNVAAKKSKTLEQKPKPDKKDNTF